MRRDQAVVTITTHKGSKSYSLFGTTLVAFWSFALVLSIVFLGSFLLLYVFKSQLSDLRSKRFIITQSLNELENRNQKLQSSILKKNSELQKLAKVEAIIGVKKTKNADYGKRLQKTQYTFIQKNFLLNTIPSGIPVRSHFFYSSPFGYRLHPITKRRTFHAGMDLAVVVGTPIYATASGVVVYSGQLTGYGNLVKIQHAYGFQTYYAHLSGTVSKVGDFVKKGQIVAYSGNTGHSTGPHLHYEVRYLHRPVNPAPFLQWSFKNYTKIFDTNQGMIQWKQLLGTVSSVVPLDPQS